jgi:hypothetical protein
VWRDFHFADCVQPAKPTSTPPANAPTTARPVGARGAQPPGDDVEGQREVLLVRRAERLGHVLEPAQAQAPERLGVLGPEQPTQDVGGVCR